MQKKSRPNNDDLNIKQQLVSNFYKFANDLSPSTVSSPNMIAINSTFKATMFKSQDRFQRSQERLTTYREQQTQSSNICEELKPLESASIEYKNRLSKLGCYPLTFKICPISNYTTALTETQAVFQPRFKRLQIPTPALLHKHQNHRKTYSQTIPKL